MSESGTLRITGTDFIREKSPLTFVYNLEKILQLDRPWMSVIAGMTQRVCTEIHRSVFFGRFWMRERWALSIFPKQTGSC